MIFLLVTRLGLGFIFSGSGLLVTGLRFGIRVTGYWLLVCNNQYTQTSNPNQYTQTSNPNCGRINTNYQARFSNTLVRLPIAFHAKLNSVLPAFLHSIPTNNLPL